MNQNIYPDERTLYKKPNEFIFLANELFLYREYKNIGKFYSYKNKSIKGIYNDNTICMMNNDKIYAKIINKFGEQKIIKIIDIPLNSPYYLYIKYLFDFYDICFNPQAIKESKRNHRDLVDAVEQRINKIDQCNSLIFNKNINDNYSKQYYFQGVPTNLDINKLLEKNDKALNFINQIKNSNNNNEI